MVQQHKAADAEAGLRAYLLADRIAFRKQMCTTLCENPAWSSVAWEQLSHSVDALAGGQPYRLHGFELPPGHWALVHGVDTDWVLDEHDVLRLA
jgi:hypothetical protein